MQAPDADMRIGDGITPCRHPITSAVAAHLDSTIMTIPRQAVGYRNQADFKTVIDLHYGR